MAKFVEMQVDSIRVHMPSGQHVVILKEKETDRYLPIWIGIYEANAIALKITGITPERPIFFFQAEDGIRDLIVTGVQTCALPISRRSRSERGTGTRGGIALPARDHRPRRPTSEERLAAARGPGGRPPAPGGARGGRERGACGHWGDRARFRRSPAA